MEGLAAVQRALQALVGLPARVEDIDARVAQLQAGTADKFDCVGERMFDMGGRIRALEIKLEEGLNAYRELNMAIFPASGFEGDLSEIRDVRALLAPLGLGRTYGPYLEIVQRTKSCLIVRCGSLRLRDWIMGWANRQRARTVGNVHLASDLSPLQQQYRKSMSGVYDLLWEMGVEPRWRGASIWYSTGSRKSSMVGPWELAHFDGDVDKMKEDVRLRMGDVPMRARSSQRARGQGGAAVAGHAAQQRPAQQGGAAAAGRAARQPPARQSGAPRAAATPPPPPSGPLLLGRQSYSAAAAPRSESPVSSRTRQQQQRNKARATRGAPDPVDGWQRPRNPARQVGEGNSHDADTGIVGPNPWAHLAGGSRSAGKLNGVSILSWNARSLTEDNLLAADSWVLATLASVDVFCIWETRHNHALREELHSHALFFSPKLPGEGHTGGTGGVIGIAHTASDKVQFVGFHNALQVGWVNVGGVLFAFPYLRPALLHDAGLTAHSACGVAIGHCRQAAHGAGGAHG